MDRELELKAKDPSTRLPAYAVMEPRWALIDALLGGTEAMRAAGEMFLPRHQAEEDIGYRDRLASATLYNMTEHTLESLVGRPFRSDPAVSDDTPPAVRALLDDVDLQGNAVGPFARDWFRSGLAKGFCACLVDFPRKDETIVTKEDASKAGLRPYWVQVEASRIIAVRSEIVGGVERLTHVRILETYEQPVGFTSVTKERIRVMEPGIVQFFEKQVVRGKVNWQQGEKFSVDMDEIPLVIWYSTKREDHLLCKPRLLDLAELNKSHWQSYADQRHILTVCRFPILACSGSNGPTKEGQDDSIVIGPNKVVYISDPAGRLYYVEHTGASIQAGRNDLMDLERQMASYGGQFLVEQPGDKTATASAIDAAESTSELAAMVKTFEDAVAKAFYFTGKWLGIAGGPTGSIELDSSWTEEVTPPQPGDKPADQSADGNGTPPKGKPAPADNQQPQDGEQQP